MMVIVQPFQIRWLEDVNFPLTLVSFLERSSEISAGLKRFFDRLWLLCVCVCVCFWLGLKSPVSQLFKNRSRWGWKCQMLRVSGVSRGWMCFCCSDWRWTERFSVRDAVAAVLLRMKQNFNSDAWRCRSFVFHWETLTNEDTENDTFRKNTEQHH